MDETPPPDPPDADPDELCETNLSGLPGAVAIRRANEESRRQIAVLCGPGLVSPAIAAAAAEIDRYCNAHKVVIDPSVLAASEASLSGARDAIRKMSAGLIDTRKMLAGRDSGIAEALKRFEEQSILPKALAGFVDSPAVQLPAIPARYFQPPPIAIMRPAPIISQPNRTDEEIAAATVETARTVGQLAVVTEAHLTALVAAIGQSVARQDAAAEREKERDEREKKRDQREAAKERMATRRSRVNTALTAAAVALGILAYLHSRPDPRPPATTPPTTTPAAPSPVPATAPTVPASSPG